MEQKSAYSILLYYRYVVIDDPEAVRAEQEEKCLQLHLLGRILVAREGINGTVSGSPAQTAAYMDWMRNHPIFKGIEFKVDTHHEHAFLHLHVRVKNEIVNLGAGWLDVPEEASNYIEPAEWLKMLKEQPDDAVIFDARSEYETSVGKFKGAISLDLDNFRDLPQRLEELSHFKDKTIYTYCTGGIKCEKVTQLLYRAGFKKVYQLHGGIVRYGHEMKGEDFEGSCYVFDQRVVVPVNQVNPTVIGKCKICSALTEKIINCANPDCNDHFLICEECAQRLSGCCSVECQQAPRVRAWDGRGYYLRGVNSKLWAHNPDPNYLRLHVSAHTHQP